MLRSLKTLLGCQVQANDGEIGHVRDALFHDRSWLVRYLVVDTGGWLSGRQVLLSPTVAQPPQLESKTLTVSLTRDQVENSPGIDTDLPVSRQQEITMSQYYGWPAYWTSEAATASESVPAGPEGDPNLRSAKEVLSYSVKTSDGDLGHIADLVMEDANWFVRYLVVTTGTWFEGERLLVGTRWVGSISWQNGEVVLPHSKDVL